MGPYEVVIAFDNGSVKIKPIDGSEVSFIVNGHRLRLYNQPTSRQVFIQNILQKREMELIEEEVIPPPLDPWNHFGLSSLVYMYICFCFYE